ncbi:hypothetical protein R5R35_013588 [Gryllus longicercus]|uniref:CHK kinase-like domain-containing protein n=1 Tax=Gryllus longicercus TaxID=2509291 RepID=A0AAN9VEU0_9ORTH
MLSADEARHIVAQNVSSPDFKILDIKETSLRNEDGGFMSDYWHIKMEVECSDSSVQTHKFFVKDVPKTDSTHREYVLEVQSYKKEGGFYMDIVPNLYKYNDACKKIKEEDVKGIWAPHCYLTRDGIIVMEDLSSAGFKVFNNRELMDWNHCVVVLRTLASFHAASITFEKRESEVVGHPCVIGDMYPDLFQSVLGKAMNDDPEKGWFAAGIRALCALVPQLTKYKGNVEVQRLIREKLPNICQTNINILGRSSQYRNVVSHGDLWSNNIMFRYQNGIPITARFVDFQLQRYAPPSSDITMFLYTTINRNFRKRHRDNLLDVYYSELTKELNKNGISVNDVLPFDELRSSCEFMTPGGRVIAALYLQVITITKEQRNTICSSGETFSQFFLCNRELEVCEWFETDEYYRNLLQDAVYDLVDEDILKN